MITDENPETEDNFESRNQKNECKNTKEETPCLQSKAETNNFNEVN